MSPENLASYNAAVQRINAMSPQDLSDSLKVGKCPYPVQFLLDVPLGMFHCELCGTMVIAGLPHGPLDPPWHPDKSLAAQLFYEQFPDLWTQEPKHA